jgi:hypothetical protein
MHSKQMFKVVCPIEKKDGTGTFWGRAGVGYRNKDDSINIYLDFLPMNGKLQLREFTEEELRERSDKRAQYSNRGSGSSGLASMASLPASASQELPF